MSKRDYSFFYQNDDNVFRMALARLPLEYRIYWPLKVLGLPRQFHTEENMKVAMEDKNSKRYRNFIRELRVVFFRDERLYNFVCESLPSDALEDIKTQISLGTAMRAARDVIGELFTEVRELRSLSARRVSALSAPTRNAEEKHSCKGIDCRFSYEYIGEKAGVE